MKFFKHSRPLNDNIQEDSDDEGFSLFLFVCFVEVIQKQNVMVKIHHVRVVGLK